MFVGKIKTDSELIFIRIKKKENQKIDVFKEVKEIIKVYLVK